MTPQRAVHIERTEDIDLIRNVLTHPKVHGAGSDDYAPPIEQFHPTVQAWPWYVAAFDAASTMPLGLFVTYPLNMACWDVHLALLPWSAGRRAIAAGQQFLDWMWEHSPAARLVAHIPEFNRPAIRIARRVGFTDVGIHPRAFRKQGALHSLRVMGISRPEELCHR